MTITPFSGVRYQKGYGLGSIFRSLARVALPLLKKPALRAGLGLASDLMSGKNVKRSLKHRAVGAVGEVVDGAVRRGTRRGNKRKRATGKRVVRRKRQRRHADVFS